MLKQLYIKASDSYYKNKYKKDKERIQKEMHKTLSNLPENEYEDFLRDLYKKRTGNELDFANPITYTQKLQWLKLYDEPEKKSVFADKYAVRSYIKDTIGEEYLIPLISIDGKDCFYNADEIDFNKLPEQFVLKCNHGSGTNIIVDNKSALTKKDIRRIKNKLNNWLRQNFAYINGLELAYRFIKPCIMIEKYMAIDGDLPDYKFYCFNGEAKNIIYDRNRFTNHERNFYDTDWKYLAIDTDCKCFGDVIPKPENLDSLVSTASAISKGFKSIRVDLYNINGKIYFGEMTFYPWGGFVGFTPNDIDYEWGNYISIDQSKRENNLKYRKK